MSELSAAFEPIRRVTVVEAVRRDILTLLADKLRPGDALPPERELMVMFKVGRSSLREALSGLTALGAIAPDSRRGYRVQSLTPPSAELPSGLVEAQMRELFDARIVLECGIAELACSRATDEDFAALAACLESIKRARRAGRTTAPAAGRFHALLAAASHNGFLEAQFKGLRGLMLKVGLHTEFGRGSTFAEEQWDAHAELLETLKSRDPAPMREAMRRHIDRFAESAIGCAGEKPQVAK